MNQRFIFLLTLFMVFFYIKTPLNAQTSNFLCPTDTLTGLVWTPLQAPPAKVNAFAQSQGRVFAATESGLYSSDDAGLHWVYRFGEGQNISSLTATDSCVFYQTVLQTTQGPYADRPNYVVNMYRSSNLGVSFQLFYSLNATAKPIDPSLTLYPHKWTPITWLGSNSFYFRHWFEAPPTGNQVFVNNLYYTKDNGATWSILSGNFPQRALVSDTIVTTPRNFAYQNGVTTYDLSIYPAADITSIPIKDTFQLANPNSFYDNFFYYNGSFFDIKWSNPTKIRQFSGFGTDSFGQNPIVSSLLFPGNPTASISKFWNEDQVLWFQLSNKQVFKSTVQNPTALVYSHTLPSTEIYAHLPAGDFKNDINFRTLWSSGDSGAIFEPRYQGLNFSAAPVFEICDKIIATSKPITNYSNFNELQMFVADTNSDWQLITMPINTIDKFFPAGQAFGKTYISILNGRLWRSSDCGDAPWTEIILPNVINKVVQIGNKAYAFKQSCGNCPAYESLDGENWIPTSFNGFYYKYYTKGDTLFKLSNSTIRISIDNGGTWIEKVFPSNLQFTNVWMKGDTLIGVKDAYNSISFSNCDNVFLSNEPNAWLNSCPILLPSSTYSNFNTVKTPSKFLGYHGGLLLLHAGGGLHVSANAGASWTRLADLPFQNYFQEPNLYTGQLFRWSADGALSYRVLDGYLYAFSSRNGILKTPIQPILDYLQNNQNNNYVRINGVIFEDQNDNCILDNFYESLINSKILQIKPGSIPLLTNEIGGFSTTLPPGNYSIETVLPQYRKFDCDSAVFTNFNLTAGQPKFIPISYEKISNIKDVKVITNSLNTARPGFDLTWHLSVKNIGTAYSNSGNLVINYNADLLDVISFPYNNPNNTPGYAEFNVNPLGYDESRDVVLNFSVKPNVALGTILNFHAHFNYQNDIDTSNNVVNLTRVVTGSFDPNDKTVEPSELLPTEVALLDYMIRFQNTGTDTAFQVIVTDTLSENLDLLSFEIVKASHPYKLELLPNRMLRWVFNNILLPDSSTNLLKSQGFIHFKIKNKPMFGGESVDNAADIFFDFNLPVHTNTASTRSIKPFLVIQLDTNICKGDTWQGQTYTSNTTVIDSISTVFFDSIFVTNLTILPNYQLVFDTIVAVGSQFYGQTITQDRIFPFFYTAQNGCDSTVFWKVHVLVNANEYLVNTDTDPIKIWPNPTQNSLNIRGLRTKSDIQIFDALGIEICSYKSMNNQETSTIDLGEIPDGVYFLVIRDLEKLIKTQVHHFQVIH
jgi:Secretion system C-terminal sorting domain